MMNEEGVSPVIATILMVAITVVLAATLYIMVSGNMFGTPYSSSKLVGSLTMIPDTSYRNSLNFTITMTLPEYSMYDNVKIAIVHNAQVGNLYYNESSGIWTNATSGGKWHYEAKLTDLDGDGKFSDGDRLWVYIVDDNPSDSVHPPEFQTGDKVLFSITGYHGTSSGGEIQL